jgi:hypothetical protein
MNKKGYQQDAHDERGAGQSELQLKNKKIGGSFTNSGCQHFDNPELGGDFRHRIKQHQGIFFRKGRHDAKALLFF